MASKVKPFLCVFVLLLLLVSLAGLYNHSNLLNRQDQRRHVLDATLDDASSPLKQALLGRTRDKHVRSQRSPDCGEQCCLPKSFDLEDAAWKAHLLRWRSQQLPRRKVAYIKTHKTASSTVGSILFRHGARHNLTLYKSPTHGLRLDVRNPATLPADIVVHHWAGIINARIKSYQDWIAAYKWYNEVVPDPDFITILREPLSHYTSYYYFYDEPRGGKNNNLAYWASQGKNKDMLARDFAIFTQDDVDHFMTNYMDKFRTLLLSNRMSESLVVLASDMGWSLWDMASVKLLDSHSKAGSTRWDGKPIKPTPKLHQLPEAVVKDLRKITQLDFVLYNYAEAKLNASIVSIGPAFVRVAASTLDQTNKALSVFCGCSDLGRPEKQYCKWFGMDDMAYERNIGARGQARLETLEFLP